MARWPWFNRERADLNGHTPPAMPATPALPATEPRMATDLGDALTAYWRSGKWWGSAEFVRWLITHGHLSEAAYALRHLLKLNLPKDVHRDLCGQERRLQALTPGRQQPDPPPAGDLPDRTAMPGDLP
ncbi:hypothetical protein [Streptosporangium sandarakinum]|uniref:hypothetical protein n=1 Tax=Streptosporangium sandarakinum TaxID=1260955 RepID=UPI0033B6D2E9